MGVHRREFDGSQRTVVVQGVDTRGKKGSIVAHWECLQERASELVPKEKTPEGNPFARNRRILIVVEWGAHRRRQVLSWKMFRRAKEYRPGSGW